MLCLCQFAPEGLLFYHQRLRQGLHLRLACLCVRRLVLEHGLDLLACSRASSSSKPALGARSQWPPFPARQKAVPVLAVAAVPRMVGHIIVHRPMRVSTSFVARHGRLCAHRCGRTCSAPYPKKGRIRKVVIGTGGSSLKTSPSVKG
jgi:hypothetical protein